MKLLMSRLLKVAILFLLTSSIVYAKDKNNKLLLDFINKNIRVGKDVKFLGATIVDVQKDKKLLGDWEAVVVKMKFKKNNDIEEKYDIVFRHGVATAFDLIDVRNMRSLKNRFSPPLTKKYYKKEKIVYGDKSGKAKHKIVLFSDPVCPFCLDFVPDVIEFVQKHPKDFSLYFYHLPLARLHPAAPTLVKAAIALELKGQKDVLKKLYQADFDSAQKDFKKTLKAFNKYFKTSLTIEDINSKEILKIYKEDIKVADELMVRGTPTIYIDGKKDPMHSMFEKLQKEYKKHK